MTIFDSILLGIGIFMAVVGFIAMLIHNRKNKKSSEDLEALEEQRREARIKQLREYQREADADAEINKFLEKEFGDTYSQEESKP